MQITDTPAATTKTPVKTRKRNFWRGFCAGLVARYLFLAIITLGEWLLRPFVWFAFTNAPYDTGPIDPNSREWLILQMLGFLAAVATGAVIARWSSRSTWLAFTTFAVILLMLTMLGPVPVNGLFHCLVWFLATPIGILLGGIAYMRREAGTT